MCGRLGTGSLILLVLRLGTEGLVGWLCGRLVTRKCIWFVECEACAKKVYLVGCVCVCFVTGGLVGWLYRIFVFKNRGH